MIDGPSAIAIALGLVAVAIAIWNHVSDATLLYLRRPVRAKSATNVDAPTYFQNGTRTKLVVVNWWVKNRLSYPLIANFSYRGVELGRVVKVEFGGDLVGMLPGTQYTLPPRQPVNLFFRAFIHEGVSGDFIPRIDLAPSGLRIPVCGKPFHLTPSLIRP